MYGETLTRDRSWLRYRGLADMVLCLRFKQEHYAASK